MSSKAALDWRECEHHGSQIHASSICVSCLREFGVAATTRPKPAIEPLPTWMKKAILGVSGNAATPVSSRRHSGVRGFAHDMSDLERSVFERLGRGVRPVDMAQELGVSFSAVSNTVTRLLDKCRVGSRSQLRVLARTEVLRARAHA